MEIDCIDDQIKKSRTNKYVYSILGIMNILAARNRESENLEIRVPVLGNHLFCA